MPSSVEEERQRSTLDGKLLAEVLDESPEYTNAKKVTALLIERDPILNAPNFHDLTRPENRALTMAQVRRVVEIKKELKDPLMIKAFDSWMNRFNRGLSMRIYVHDTLFRESVFTQGTHEQWNSWRDDIENWRVIGCFAMTELGHSSFLRGLETTAIYDKTTQEFIIHSPTLTATKWWIGMVGQVATHTVALCKLIIDNQEYGVYWFIVPLRDRNTGALLPGVTAGDCGAKVGRNGLDNGWIQFTRVRIPREYMLMKWAKVSPDGKFTAPPNAALSYNALIGERLMAVGGVAEALSSALIISVRYGVTRKQGPNDEKIIDFQSHQWSLMPLLASAYAFGIVFQEVSNDWSALLKTQNENKDNFVRSLVDWHGLAAGLKAWLGWWGADGLEAVRRTMGGHAFSSYAAIGGIIADFGVMTTGGGDNIVLAQQSTKVLLSTLKRAMTGKPMTGSTAYFAELDTILSCDKIQVANIAALDNDPKAILFAFRWVTLKLLTRTGEKLASMMGGNTNPEALESVWNDNMMESIAASKFHTYHFVLQVFYNYIQQKRANKTPERIVYSLSKLWSLLALTFIVRESSTFLELSYITGDDLVAIRARFSTLCKEVRQDAVPLVDAFDVPDFMLRTPLARYDGDIYPHYFKTVVDAPNSLGVPSYFESEIAPLTRIQQQPSKL